MSPIIIETCVFYSLYLKSITRVISLSLSKPKAKKRLRSRGKTNLLVSLMENFRFNFQNSKQTCFQNDSSILENMRIFKPKDPFPPERNLSY